MSTSIEKELVCEITDNLKIYTARIPAYMEDGLAKHTMPNYYIRFTDPDESVQEIDVIQLYYSLVEEDIRQPWKTVNDQICVITSRDDLGFMDIIQIMNQSGQSIPSSAFLDPLNWYNWTEIRGTFPTDPSDGQVYFNTKDGYIGARDLLRIVDFAAPTTYSRSWGLHRKENYDAEAAIGKARAEFHEKLVSFNHLAPTPPTPAFAGRLSDVGHT